MAANAEQGAKAGAEKSAVAGEEMRRTVVREAVQLDGAAGLQEPLADPVFAEGVITAQVISFGCTSSRGFHVEYEVDGESCRVTVVRDEADLCKAAPHPVGIAIDWELPDGCSAAAVEFTNPPLEAPKKHRLVDTLDDAPKGEN